MSNSQKRLRDRASVGLDAVNRLHQLGSRLSLARLLESEACGHVALGRDLGSARLGDALGPVQEHVFRGVLTSDQVVGLGGLHVASVAGLDF